MARRMPCQKTKLALIGHIDSGMVVKWLFLTLKCLPCAHLAQLGFAEPLEAL